MTPKETIQKTILIVDDEPDVITILKTALARRGYKIEIAIDGEEALEKVKKNPPDLIILDVMMPKLDGFAVKLRLDAFPETAKIPVIFLSGTDKGFQEKYLGLREKLEGAIYINKPIPIKAFLEQVEEIVG